jgi:6-phosphogluconolactonase
MKHILRKTLGITCLALLAAAGVAQADDYRPRERGAVYTMTNSAAGNAVRVYERAANGQLSPAGDFSTGGRGSGGGLGNQGAIALDEDGRLLYAVNAGSNDISVFAVRGTSLRLIQTVATGGVRPVSLTMDDDLLYVLNAGSDSISGYRINNWGGLRPLANSSRGLSGAGTAAAQISLAPDGRTLVITEKATNNLVVYPLDARGLPAATPTIVASSGTTPFGFSFNGRRQLIVSEAFGGAAGRSAVSSYQLRRDGSLRVVSASVATGQTAACWIVNTPDRRFAYTTNTGSGNISGYRVGGGGVLTRFDDGGVTADLGAGSGPIDMGITPDGDYVYVLNSGNQSISLMRVEQNGALTVLQNVGGLPVGANGLAVR